jgi:hypothetical protein
MSDVFCPYCEAPAVLTTGKEIYPHRQDLWTKSFYLCQPCRAWVGCHEGTTRPLGRLANEALRRAKIRAHAAFDPLWRSGLIKRKQAYALLAAALNIDRKRCHIGYFTLTMCERTIEIAVQLKQELASVND